MRVYRALIDTVTDLRALGRFLRGQPVLVTVLAMVTVVATLGQSYAVWLPPLAYQGLGGGPDSYSALAAAQGVGAMIGAGLSTRRHGKPRPRVVLGGALTFGLITTISGLMPTVALTVVALVTFGITEQLYNTATDAYVHLSAEDTEQSFRGRVLGLYNVLLYLGDPISAPLLGLAGERWGGRASTVIAGVSSVLAVVIGAAVLLRPARLNRLIGMYRTDWRRGGRWLGQGALVLAVAMLLVLGDLFAVMAAASGHGQAATASVCGQWC